MPNVFGGAGGQPMPGSAAIDPPSDPGAWWEYPHIGDPATDPLHGRGPGRGGHTGPGRPADVPGVPMPDMHPLSPLGRLVQAHLNGTTALTRNIVGAARHGTLFDPSGAVNPMFTPAPGDPHPWTALDQLPDQTQVLLHRLDTLGDQRQALPKGPERRGVRKQIRQVIHRPNPGGI